MAKTMNDLILKEILAIKNVSTSILRDHIYEIEYQSGPLRRKCKFPFEKFRIEKFCDKEGVCTRVFLSNGENKTVLDYYPSEVLSQRRTYIKNELVKTERWDKEGQYPEILLYKNDTWFYHSGWEGNIKIKEFYHKNKNYYHNYRDGKLFWRRRIKEITEGAKRSLYVNGKLSEEAIFDGRFELERKYFNEKGVFHTIRVLGAYVDMKYYLNPQIIPPEMIINERDTTIRRAYLHLLGYGSFLQKVGGVTIHKDGDYELVKVNLPLRFQQPMVLHKVLCPSTSVYYTLRVPPTMNNCKVAVAWTFNMTPEEYQLSEEA